MTISINIYSLVELEMPGDSFKESYYTTEIGNVGILCGAIQTAYCHPMVCEVVKNGNTSGLDTLLLHKQRGMS